MLTALSVVYIQSQVSFKKLNIQIVMSPSLLSVWAKTHYCSSDWGKTFALSDRGNCRLGYWCSASKLRLCKCIYFGRRHHHRCCIVVHHLVQVVVLMRFSNGCIRLVTLSLIKSFSLRLYDIFKVYGLIRQPAYCWIVIVNIIVWNVVDLACSDASTYSLIR